MSFFSSVTLFVSFERLHRIRNKKDRLVDNDDVIEGFEEEIHEDIGEADQGQWEDDDEVDDYY